LDDVDAGLLRDRRRRIGAAGIDDDDVGKSVERGKARWKRLLLVLHRNDGGDGYEAGLGR
jgi:hypothetical protein